jgi:hypothetical protein
MRCWYAGKYERITAESYARDWRVFLRIRESVRNRVSMNVKKPQIQKPILDANLAMTFAEDRPQATVEKTARPKSEEAEEPRSGKVPKGDVRLTVNVRQDLHLRLKVEAAHRRTTIGEILEELIEAHVDIRR